MFVSLLGLSIIAPLAKNLIKGSQEIKEIPFTFPMLLLNMDMYNFLPVNLGFDGGWETN